MIVAFYLTQFTYVSGKTGLASAQIAYWFSVF